MKKTFSLAAVLAIAISASAATKISWPTGSDKFPSWPVIEGKFHKFPAEPKYPKFPAESKFPRFPAEPKFPHGLQKQYVVG